MRASVESGGNALLQCSQVGRSSRRESSIICKKHQAGTFYVAERDGSMARWRIQAHASVFWFFFVFMDY